MKTQIVLSSAFKRQLEKIVKKNPALKNKISKVFKILLKNPNSPLLKLHKLSGENNWAISITYSIRAVIHIDTGLIFFLRIGTHDQIY